MRMRQDLKITMHRVLQNIVEIVVLGGAKHLTRSCLTCCVDVVQREKKQAKERTNATVPQTVSLWPPCQKSSHSRPSFPSLG